MTMTSHTESTLKALTVPKLKELLAQASLVQTGKKDDLIARLLENPTALIDTATAATTTTAVPTVSDAVIPTPAVGATTATTTSTSSNPSLPSSTVPISTVATTPTAEEVAAKAQAEEEKRQKRSERFGMTKVESEGGDPALLKRAERFGIVKEVDNKVTTSLAALDKPLGEKKQRVPKPAPSTDPKTAVVPTPAPKAAANAKPVAATKTPTVVDPLLAQKMLEEEEKKKKRAARFGGGGVDEPVEKKTKVDT